MMLSPNASNAVFVVSKMVKKGLLHNITHTIDNPILESNAVILGRMKPTLVFLHALLRTRLTRVVCACGRGSPLPRCIRALCGTGGKIEFLCHCRHLSTAGGSSTR